MPDMDVLQIVEARRRAIVRLKSYSASPVWAAFASAFGDSIRLLHVGPGESLVISDVMDGSSLRYSLQGHLLKQGIAVTDLSDGVKILRVEGTAAESLLNKGCGVDLHPRMFPAGYCTRTRFAQIPVVIDCLQATRRFELHVGRSYVHYLHAWLLDAAAELRRGAIPN